MIGAAPDPYSGGMSAYDPQEFTGGPTAEETENGLFEITIRVRGATKVNRLLSWIVRSRAYDDVDALNVAFQGDDAVESKAS